MSVLDNLYDHYPHHHCSKGLDNPVLKWSLPDNSHVCLVSESGDNESPDRDHVSRDMAVSVNIAQFFSVV